MSNLHQRGSSRLAIIVGTVAGAIALTGAMSGAQGAAQSATFAVGDASMCENGELDHTSYTYGSGYVGSGTPEAAAEVIALEVRNGVLETQRVLARIDSKYADDITELLAPSANFRAGERRASEDAATVYFDTASGQGDVLSSRLVVRVQNNSFVVTDLYRCENAITTNATELHKLLLKGPKQ